MRLPTDTRDQLSLYVPPPIDAPLEAVRRQLDPIQSGLIPAHVTLCREDELTALGAQQIRARLAEGRPITLRFGRAERFQEHGILLPCIEGEEAFRALRERVLGSRNIRRHAPHITLAHPRNPKSEHNRLANTTALPEPLAVTFATVRRIRQGIAPWRVLEVSVLTGVAV